jgi:hypothetical protein
MPALTRRRDLEAPDECWHVYYGDVRAGTIAKRVGIPFDEDLWGWACASTRAHTRANARTVRPLPSTTRAPSSRKHGGFFYQTGPRLTSRNGAKPKGDQRSPVAMDCELAGMRVVRFPGEQCGKDRPKKNQLQRNHAR